MPTPSTTAIPIKKSRLPKWFPRRGVPLADMVFFFDNLRVMIHAGLSYNQAFHTLVTQTTNRRWKAILEDIALRVERGETLAVAMERFPAFTPLMTNMMRIGEISGTLDGALTALVNQMKKDLTLRAKIRGALMYPCVILSATGVISVGMMIFVVPKILEIFKDIKTPLPLPTRILLAVSGLVTEHGLVVGIALVATMIALHFFIKTPFGKRLMHTLFLRAWILGPIVRKINLARMTRTLSTLLRTGIPIQDALTNTGRVLSNVHFQEALFATTTAVNRGASIGDALAQHPHLFPSIVTQMAAVGEQAGQLDEMLGELAVYYESQVDDTLSNMTQIIEPVLVLTLGVAVGGIAVAIISPIYALSESF